MQELNDQEVLEVGGGDEIVVSDEHDTHNFFGQVFHAMTWGWW